MVNKEEAVLRIEGNVVVPEGEKEFFKTSINEFFNRLGYTFAGTITDAATSPHVLILKEELEGLHNRIERQRDAIAYLQEKEVKQDEEFQKITKDYTESLQRKQKLVDKAWADYDQVVKELTKERAANEKLKSENAMMLKAFKAKASKPNVFKRIWKWFRSTVNQ